MVSEHTKGPWFLIAADGADFTAIATKPVIDGDYDPESEVLGTSEWLRCSDADLRRIVACVNACEGASTELLEEVGSNWAQEYLNEFQHGLRLTKQRDELLAALEAIAADDFAAPHDATDADISYEKGRLIMRTRRAAQAAIAAAKGGAVTIEDLQQLCSERKMSPECAARIIEAHKAKGGAV